MSYNGAIIWRTLLDETSEKKNRQKFAGKTRFREKQKLHDIYYRKSLSNTFKSSIKIFENKLTIEEFHFVLNVFRCK